MSRSIVGTATVSALFFGCAVAHAASTGPRQEQDAAPARHSDHSQPVTESNAGIIPGIARPLHEVTKTAPVDGAVMQVLCKEGDTVEAGAPLVILDNRVAVAAVAAARAAAERSAAITMSRQDIELADRKLKRVEKSTRSHASNQLELDDAKAGLWRAESALAAALEDKKQAELNLDLELAKLEQHIIRAPFDGRIVRLFADLGATVTPSTPILQIVALDSLVVELPVPSEFFGTLKTNRIYELEADAPVNEVLSCRLLVQHPIIDSASGTFRCLFEIANHDGKLPAGFSVLPRIRDGALIDATDEHDTVQASVDDED